MADGYLPFWGHVEELRRRLLWCVAAWALGAVAAYGWKDPLFEWFVQPVGKLVFLTPTGAFGLYVKLSVAAGFVLAFPLIVWQLWGFASPALHEHEMRTFVRYGFSTVALFAAGMACGWELVWPSATYLMSFENHRLVGMITVEAYSSFVLLLVLGTGMMFEMPMVFLWLSRLGWVSSPWLIEQWRLAVVGCVVVSALVTPTTDPVTQVLVAAPMVVLYAVSIVCVRIGENRRAKSMMMEAV